MFKIACIFAFAVVAAAAGKDELGHSHFTITHYGHHDDHNDHAEKSEHDFGSYGSFDGEYKFDDHDNKGHFDGHDIKFEDHHEEHKEDHHEEHKEDHHDYHDEPKYSYDYGVHDHHTGDNKNAWETRHGDKVKGGYTFHEADGTQRVVEYTADKHSGFNAIVKRIGHAKHPAIYTKHEEHKSEEHSHEHEHEQKHEEKYEQKHEESYEHKHEQEHKHEHGATSYSNFYLHSTKH